MKNKLLIVHPSQFGYHTDTYMYCKYINKDIFDVYYIGFDLGYEKVILPNVNVIYIDSRNHRIIRYFQFFKKCIEIRRIGFSVVFHTYAKFSFLFRFIFLFDKYILDIRTGDLSKNKVVCAYKNFNIKLLSLISRNVTIISKSLADHLSITPNKRIILPLGGELLDMDAKCFDEIRLIYVGTLEKRNIHETIIGLGLFVSKYNIRFKYDIIGTGSDEDLSLIRDAINKFKLEKEVSLLGFIKYERLTPYLEKANLGIVYIPQEDYYHYQPSTKLYEYLLAGMPVIATSTHENCRELNNNHHLGVLCQDQSESFCDALFEFYINRSSYDSNLIKEQMKTSEWNYIVNQVLEPQLNRIINE